MPQTEPLFCAPPADACEILANYDKIIQDVLPLSAKQRITLPLEIQKLSRILTSARTSMRTDYLNNAAVNTAYIHYFHWWNLVRLTRLFSALPADAFAIPDDGVCLDLGSGPLTVPAALWLSRPELRKKPLTWYCLDRSRSIMAAGEELFLALTARLTSNTEWHIIRVQGEIGTAVRKKAHFVAAANVFNEMIRGGNALVSAANPLIEKTAAGIFSYAESGASILLVEPGIPTASRFLSLMRTSLLRHDCAILSPCPPLSVHSSMQAQRCPMDGKRGGKWCHFVFPASLAPEKLQKLSEAAKLQKDRASLSFLLAAYKKPPALQEKQETPQPFSVRIASDPIRLTGSGNKNQSEKRTGFYACTELGLTLVEYKHQASLPASGDLIKLLVRPAATRRDSKTGAAIILVD